MCFAIFLYQTKTQKYIQSWVDSQKAHPYIFLGHERKVLFPNNPIENRIRNLELGSVLLVQLYHGVHRVR